MNYKILEDVYLGSNGLIFDKNKEILSLNRYDKFVHVNKNFDDYIIEELYLDEYVDMTHYYRFWPFAHRYDCLSRLRHIEDLIHKDTHFIIGGNSKFHPIRFDEECKLFGINNKIHHRVSNTLFKIKKLIYPLWLNSESPVQFTFESFEYCRNKYINMFEDKEEKYKLFLTRTNIKRGLINYEEIHDFLKEKGFIIVNGSEDFHTIVNYFYNAEIIVGLHGGLFSNMIFCRKPKKIIEIFSDKYNNGCFLGWKKHLDVDFYEQITYKSAPNGNIHIDKNNLKYE